MNINLNTITKININLVETDFIQNKKAKEILGILKTSVEDLRIAFNEQEPEKRLELIDEKIHIKNGFILKKVINSGLSFDHLPETVKKLQVVKDYKDSINVFENHDLSENNIIKLAKKIGITKEQLTDINKLNREGKILKNNEFKSKPKK